ncbi:MAG: DUF2288 domain-containing protein [Gammaproteobacteria bacterium]|nr:DUF2288 domain-containing protein [Gammaproteobacteria bacterium]
MIEELLRQDRELKRGKIISETARIPWQELQRFFAAGKVMLVAPGLDLVDVAFALQEDDVDQVKSWTEALQVMPVPDDQAKEWIASDALLWAVVVKPWVLVQTIGPDS